MLFIAAGREGVVGEAEGLVEAWGFRVARDDTVDRVVVFGVGEMDFVGGDADYGA